MGPRAGDWLGPVRLPAHRVARAGVLTATGVLGAVLTWEASQQPWWIRLPFVLWGLFTMVIGAVVGADPLRHHQSTLIITAGVVYYFDVGRLATQPVVFAVAYCLSYLWAAVLAHAALSWARPFLGTGWYRVLTVAAYLSAVEGQTLRFLLDRPTPPLAPFWDEQNRPGTRAEGLATLSFLVVIVTTFVVLGVRWAAVTRLRRRVTLPMWLALGAGGGACLTVAALSVLHAPPLVRMAATATAICVVQTGWLTTPRVRDAWADWLRWRTADRILGLHSGPDLLGRPADLQHALGEALGDPNLRLYYPVPDGYLDVHGQFAALAELDARVARSPVRRGGQLLAVLEHDAALSEWRDVSEAALGIAGLAIESTYLQAVARARTDTIIQSGRRLIAATTQERQRIQHNLHDGAQQLLFSVLALLDRARHEVATGTATPDVAAQIITRAHQQLADAIAELRRLSQGLYPATLSEYGLAAAVEALADTTPLTLHRDIAPGRWPEEVEATAYFVIAEAITNAMKHARANEVTIVVNETNGRLSVRVVDDGPGGATIRPGGGLFHLRDRVKTAGGQLTVGDAQPRGTLVSATLALTAIDLDSSMVDDVPR